MPENREINPPNHEWALRILESHALLAQIPLTVSPFISLPTATTLPYTYKTLPSTLPASSTSGASASSAEKTKYIVSTSGHAAHPDDVIASCKALQAYMQKMQDDADRDLQRWGELIEERDLAEKRRVAPGWLDSEARILEPERMADRKDETTTVTEYKDSILDTDVGRADRPNLEDGHVQSGIAAGDELDRAFGSMGL